MYKNIVFDFGGVMVDFAGDPAGIQQLPFLTAEGQGKDFVLHLVVPEQIDQILVRVL